MAKESRGTRWSLLLLAASACAQGVDSIDTPGVAPSNDTAGSADPGESGQTGVASGAGAGSTASTGGSGHSAGATGSGTGAVSAGGTATAGSASGGSSAGSASAGSAQGGSINTAGSASGGSSAGNASAGASAGGVSSAGAAGSANSAGSGNSAGSAGAGAAPCSGKKPEANCSCQSFNDHDYWFCPTGHDFTTCESSCVSAGLHLAHVTSAAEDKWINDAASAASFGEYWLGSTDASTPNTWTWLAGGTFWTGLANGTASGYAHWNTGEPNASGDCLVVQTGFVWDDRICTDQRKYICD